MRHAMFSTRFSILLLLATKPGTGGNILKRAGSYSPDLIDLHKGNLYPELGRMVKPKDGVLTHNVLSPDKPISVYSITEKGQRELANNLRVIARFLCLDGKKFRLIMNKFLGEQAAESLGLEANMEPNESQ